MARELVSTRLNALLSDGTISSRRSFARQCGLSPNTLTELLAGNSDPTLSTLLMLVAGLGARSVEELLSPFGTSTALDLARSAKP